MGWRRRVLGLWRPSGARSPLISAHLHFHPSPKGARPNPCGTTPLFPPPRGRLRRSPGPGRVASLSDPRALKKSNRDLRIADLRRVTAEPRAARVWRRVNPPIERVGTSCRYARHRNRGVFTRSIAKDSTRAPARRRCPSVASPEPCGCGSSRLDRSVADRHPAPFPHHHAATMASKDGSTFFFTSESVNEGHPDKLADQVRPASPRLRARRPPPSPLQTEQRSFFPPSRPRMEIWGCGAPGRKRRRRRTFGASNVHFEPALTSHLPHVVHTADLRCRPRRVSRRGPRLQGATTDRHRPFWQKPKTKNQKINLRIDPNLTLLSPISPL